MWKAVINHSQLSFAIRLCCHLTERAQLSVCDIMRYLKIYALECTLYSTLTAASDT